MIQHFVDDIGDSEVAKQLKILGIDEENIRYAVTEFRKRTGSLNQYKCFVQFLIWLFWNVIEVNKLM